MNEKADSFFLPVGAPGELGIEKIAAWSGEEELKLSAEMESR